MTKIKVESCFKCPLLAVDAREANCLHPTVVGADVNLFDFYSFIISGESCNERHPDCPLEKEQLVIEAKK